MAMEAHYIVAWIIGLSLFLFFFTAYRRYRVDVLRYRLFVARDELFKCAEKGVIDFDEPAYEMTRTTLNGMLRFSHELNLFRIFVYVVSYKLKINTKSVERYQNEFRASMDGLGVKEKRAIVETMAKAHVAITAHIMTTSILFFWWVAPLASVAVFMKKRGIFERRISTGSETRKRWALIDGEANCIGNPHFCR